MWKPKRDVLLVFISALLTLSTLFISEQVDSREELSKNKLGYPVHFVIQDVSGLSIGKPDSAPFPYDLALRSIWDHPARFLWVNFFVSTSIIYSIVRLFILYVVRKLGRQKPPVS